MLVTAGCAFVVSWAETTICCVGANRGFETNFSGKTNLHTTSHNLVLEVSELIARRGLFLGWKFTYGAKELVLERKHPAEVCAGSFSFTQPDKPFCSFPDVRFLQENTPHKNKETTQQTNY